LKVAYLLDIPAFSSDKKVKLKLLPKSGQCEI